MEDRIGSCGETVNVCNRRPLCPGEASRESAASGVRFRFGHTLMYPFKFGNTLTVLWGFSEFLSSVTVIHIHWATPHPSTLLARVIPTFPLGDAAFEYSHFAFICIQHIPKQYFHLLFIRQSAVAVKIK